MSDIQAADVAALLAGCSELLRTEWERVQADWLPDDPPPTVALGALGTSLIGSLNGATDHELSRLASTVEHVLAAGSESAKNAIATGFLEAVLSASGKEPTATRFLGKLGQVARKYCRDWDVFCGVRTQGVWNEP